MARDPRLNYTEAIFRRLKRRCKEISARLMVVRFDGLREHPPSRHHDNEISVVPSLCAHLVIR